jgi:hypothetical protein
MNKAHVVQTGQLENVLREKEVMIGLRRIVALCHRSSTLYQISLMYSEPPFQLEWRYRIH